MHQHDFGPHSGRLRDIPEVGVLRCRACGEIRHATDVRSRVSYEQGSMSRSTRSLQKLDKLTSVDNQRRCQSIFKFAQKAKRSEIRLLDFGCGEGEFVEAASSLGFEAVGFDIDPFAIEEAQLRGVRGTSDFSKIGPSKSFDAITLFHVVEHLYEPERELARIRGLLSDNGSLFVETPNANDALITLYENEAFMNFTFWSHHPRIFSAQSLNELLVSAGFEVKTHSSVVRYGLNNHLYWLSKNKPGGHSLFPKIFSEELEEEYATNLVKNDLGDTLWFEAYLPK